MEFVEVDLSAPRRATAKAAVVSGDARSRIAPLRSKLQEEVIQNYNPEQEAMHYVQAQHKAEQAWAEDCARQFLSKLRGEEAKHGLKHAINMAADRTLLYKWVVLMEVTDSHVEYCCDLIQAVARARYAPR